MASGKARDKGPGFAEIAEAIAAEIRAGGKESSEPEKGSAKWREAIMDAILGTDEKALRSLLEGGPPPVFLSEGTNRQTPLRKAVMESWGAGVKALLEFGAEEPESLFAAADEKRNGPFPRALETAAVCEESEMFRMLLAAEKSPKRARSGAESAALHSAACFQVALDALGAKALPKGKSPFFSEYDHMSYGYASADTDSERAKTALRLAGMFPEEARGLEASRDLWAQALGNDVLELAEGLAKAGISPSGPEGGWELPMERDDLEDWAAAALLWGPLGDEAEENGEEIWRPTALAFACCAQSKGMRQALLKSTKMLERTMASEDSLRLLSGCFDLEALRDIKAAGADLEKLRDPVSGRNPLHALAIRGEAKTTMRRGISLCPAWGAQLDADGVAPAGLCESPATRADMERVLAGKALGRSPIKSAPKRRGI